PELLKLPTAYTASRLGSRRTDGDTLRHRPRDDPRAAHRDGEPGHPSLRVGRRGPRRGHRAPDAVRRRAHRGRAVVYLGREGEGDLRGDPGVLAKERHVGAEAASARRLAHPAEEERRERRAVDALTL